MKIFNRHGLGRTLLVTTAVVFGTGFASGAVAQEALVPFLVNVDATIKAAYTDGYTVTSQVQTSATANEETILCIPLSSIGVLKGAQRQANVPVVISNRGGKVTVNLPAQSYGNAEISLYTVNGKQILRRNVSASNTVNNILRMNVATGAYLLSIRGTDWNAVTSRLTHKGGNLDIDVAFWGGSENHARQQAKETAAPSYWRITVSASGYIDESYVFTPVSGMNPLQNITLRQTSSGDGDNQGGSGTFTDSRNGKTYKTVKMPDGKRWMAENLNYPAQNIGNSWCSGDNESNCDKYGLLYDWNGARMSCPSGWHLPSRQEWIDLRTKTGGSMSGIEIESEKRLVSKR
jgi:hypothetical protein